MKYFMVGVMLLGLNLLGDCSKKEDESHLVRHPEPDSPELNSDEADLEREATIWRHWKPWKLWKLDSQRTVTHRESSLIVSRRYSASDRADFKDCYETSARHSNSNRPLSSPPGGMIATRCKGSVQKELVTLLFESMLNNIVASWEVIVPPKREDSIPNELTKSSSEMTVRSKKKKNIVANKPASSHSSKAKRSKDLSETTQVDLMQQIWWSAPDERAVIRFRNGNIYEGSISMKCMNGEGRFQWADGTVYLGQFKDNQMKGKGMIQWKDDTWYEGDFLGNVRHGVGIYVDSRKQCSYSGGWHCGTKHGQGVIYYSQTFKNSYEGDWVHNVRHGFGSREYCPVSGYKGEWENDVRDGKGLMIWPNHDFYRGEWKNRVMSGHGIYIWDAHYNNTLSLPSISSYRGQWIDGQRNGYGVLNLGLGLGSFYKGEFKNNKKHGAGKFVTVNGMILEDTNLFDDDNIGPTSADDKNKSLSYNKQFQIEEPNPFNFYDPSVGLLYHVQDAIKNIDHQIEIRTKLINDYIEGNKTITTDICLVTHKTPSKEDYADINLEDLVIFEQTSLQNSLRCYENQHKNIYYKYATICNTEEIYFTPILTRLFLWQFYFDCNIHEKKLTFVETDKMFHRNPEWLSESPHDPFQKIYFWQFIHSLISVASRLYAKKEFPGPKPDTILASAFRTFMEKDVLPNVGNKKGHLVNFYGQFIPVKGLYKLYCSLNEPHTVRQFLSAIRRGSHDMDNPKPPLVDAPDECLPLGHNVYIFGDEMSFVSGMIIYH